MQGSMKVITIYGSKSDLPFMEPARVYFQENNVEHEEVIYSAHRDLPALIEYLKELEANGTKAVLLCAQKQKKEILRNRTEERERGGIERGWTWPQGLRWKRAAPELTMVTAPQPLQPRDKAAPS